MVDINCFYTLQSSMVMHSLEWKVFIMQCTCIICFSTLYMYTSIVSFETCCRLALPLLVRKWNIVIVVVTSSTFHFLFLLICQGWNMEIQKMKLKKKKCIDEGNFRSYFLARNFFIEFLTSLLNVKWWPYLLLLQVNDV